MLSSLEVVDSNPSTMVKFDTHEVHPHLPYHVAFLVHVECMNKMIKHTVVNEGVVAFVMSLSCLKYLGSPTLSKSGTILTASDGRSFRTHGKLPSLQVQLGGKTVSIEV